MPVQSTDTTATIAFASSGLSWLIKSGVAVSTNSASAVSSSFNSSSLFNNGFLQSNSAGVDFSNCSASVITNGEDGYISSGNAVSVQGGTEVRVINYGHINGNYSGILMNGSTTSIFNSGTVEGYLNGVLLAGTGSNIIHNTGLIDGALRGLYINTSDLDGADIYNSGTIRGGVAIELGGWNAKLANAGEITGQIDLTGEQASSLVSNTGHITGALSFGGASDTYDGRGGAITGVVFGGEGNDTLFGGAGDETLQGGLGRDRMDGGHGDDTFVFTDVRDSRLSSMDVISKHWSAADVIDMSLIDADSHTGGQQHLAWGGAVAVGASLTAGQIQYFQQAGDTFVVADTNGDGKADFELRIHGAFTLDPGEFML